MRFRPLIAGLLAVAVSGVGATSSDGPKPAHAVDRVLSAYRSPLPGWLDVVRPFDPPATRFGPGHLGVDLRAHSAEVVYAAGAGVVSFAGSVAGRGVVVVTHPDGIRTEYEPVRPLVRSGTRVRAGQLIATVRGVHKGCAGTCLHWGARRGDRYINPLDLLRPLGPVVLLPWSKPG
jgi:murein DD-endopeptidase MepM/ murein hydrolase activator NlpD